MTLTVLAALVVLVVLTVHNLGVERLRPALYVPACWATTAALVGPARWAGVDGDGLGLSASGLGAGMAVGGAAAAVVVVACLLPATRPLFADRRMAGVGLPGTAYRALVRIPLGTVLVEEVAFRGVLGALLTRVAPAPWALAFSSLAFGLWHLTPMVATLRTNRLPIRATVLVGTVVATGLAGAGLGWLRLATGGLAAPAIVHASATASATIAAAVVLRRPETKAP